MTQRVALLATGGTIASVRQDYGGWEASLKAQEILDRTAIPQGVEVRCYDHSVINSFRMDADYLLGLAVRLRELLSDSSLAGVVVTQGTDTMEEVAWFCELAVRAEAPLVFTGAQRAADHSEPDGESNLSRSLLVAADGKARGLGAVICFHGLLLGAQQAAKVHSGAARGFGSPGTPPLATYDEAQSGWRFGENLPLRFPNLALPDTLAVEARVFLIKATLGDDGTLVRAALKAGARGLVVEGFGIGDVPPALGAAMIEAAEAGVVVVMTTRCAAGYAAPVYGAEGGGHALAQAGVLFSESLLGLKLRILLMLLLGTNHSHEQIAGLVQRKQSA